MTLCCFRVLFFAAIEYSEEEDDSSFDARDDEFADNDNENDHATTEGACIVVLFRGVSTTVTIS